MEGGRERESDGERGPPPAALETPAARVQPVRRVKTKEPGFWHAA